MNVYEIIQDWLTDNGFDGLYNEELNCGCEISNLAPCDFLCTDCEAGYKVLCTEKCEHEFEFKPGNWHIQKSKPSSKV